MNLMIKFTSSWSTPLTAKFLITTNRPASSRTLRQTVVSTTRYKSSTQIDIFQKNKSLSSHDSYYLPSPISTVKKLYTLTSNPKTSFLTHKTMLSLQTLALLRSSMKMKTRFCHITAPTSSWLQNATRQVSILSTTVGVRQTSGH